MNGDKPVEIGAVVWRWGAIASLLAVAFVAGQYVGRSASIANNTLRVERLEGQVANLATLASTVPLIVQRLEALERWHDDIESVRESRGTAQAAMAQQQATMAAAIARIENRLDRIDARLEQRP